jgi:S-adenosylmethionine-diacylgycerolhomoserine-N-methlytransferase
MVDEAGRRMDRMYRFQRHIYDLSRSHYLLGRTTLIDGLVPPDGGSVLEVGCGTGWNLVQAARKYPTVTFYGVDVSAVMLQTARRKIVSAGLERRVFVAAADATRLDTTDVFGVAAFDRVFTSYVLSMVPNWTTALSKAAGGVASGGSLHIVDFGSGGGLPAPVRVGLHAWLDLFDVVPRWELANEVARLARLEQLTPFYTELHRGYAQYAVLTRR